jgi:transcriptional regulator with XRE-family HTH domain
LLRQRSKDFAAQEYNGGEMKNIIGKRVQKARRKFSPPLSLEDLAARLGAEGWKISRRTLGNIEAGTRKVTDIEVMVLARVLNVPAESLLDMQMLERIFKKVGG